MPPFDLFSPLRRMMMPIWRRLSGHLQVVAAAAVEEEEEKEERDGINEAVVESTTSQFVRTDRSMTSG